MLALVHSTCFSQDSSKYSLAVSTGRVLFGTGDVVGYGINVEGLKRINKISRPGLHQLHIGVELLFEQGQSKIRVKNPTDQEFITEVFHHVSNTALWIKVKYHPLGWFVAGFHIDVGAVAGYTLQSRQSQAIRLNVANTSYKATLLRFTSGVVIGYRVGLGWDLPISRRISVGPRADFENFTNGDINTLAGLKLVIRF